MQGQKNHNHGTSRGWFRRELKFLGLFLVFISFFNLIFSKNTFALYTPTLSASVDNSAVSVNGSQVINSVNGTTELPLRVTVNTNNKTGYTATLNTETNETALVNADSVSGAKIDSIDVGKSLTNFSQNTWGYKIGSATDYLPIPALSTPSQILKTTGKTNGDEANNLKLGMKLDETLESGSYNNKLIFSILTNNYEYKTIMAKGSEFNSRLKSLETTTDKIEHFKKSPTPPVVTASAKNVEDENSDYEIKLWLDLVDKTAYYYTESEKVYLNENSSRMFQGMSNIISLDLSNFDTSRVTDMSRMFFDMRILTSLNLANFNTSKVMNMSDMFYYVSSLTSLDLSNFDTSQVTNMRYMLSYMPNLTSFSLSNFDTSKVTDMGHMFSGMSSLTSLDLSNFDTSRVTNMSYMFSGMSNLTTINLSNFDTSRVTTMQSMFGDMSNLTTINLSNFDTSRVTNMMYMFYGMSNLTTLDLSNFDTSNVVYISGMFSGTSSLTSLNLFNFDTSKVTRMNFMFDGMSSLTSLDLSNFDTSMVTDMESMFRGMSSINSLDISNFDTSMVTDMENMFSLDSEDINNDKLERIYVNNDFNTSQLTSFSNMFKNRKKLRGGNGSYLADPSTADKTWLRVDCPGVQGYFTRKT